MYFICGQENNSSRKYSLFDERERESRQKERYVESVIVREREREKEGLIRTDRRKE